MISGRAFERISESQQINKNNIETHSHLLISIKERFKLSG